MCVRVCVLCMHKCMLVCGVSGYHGNRNGLNCPWVVATRSMKRLATDIFRLVQNRFGSMKGVIEKS